LRLQFQKSDISGMNSSSIALMAAISNILEDKFEAYFHMGTSLQIESNIPRPFRLL